MAKKKSHKKNTGGSSKRPKLHGGKQGGGDVLDLLFRLCRKDDWPAVLRHITQAPGLIARPIAMENNISTTILHQAITSKGNTAERAQVISFILRTEPGAAKVRNGYGSLPLHVISQRNTKMDSKTKERLIREMVGAYKGALVQTGGVGKRTPLHIIFTDYVSPGLTQLLVENATQACFMKDKKGFLPAHVACSRHCSPEKLRMLLHVNPQALFDTTDHGQTLLDLAKSTATTTHPNNTLIKELVFQLSQNGGLSENHDTDIMVPTKSKSAAAVALKPKKKKRTTRKRTAIQRAPSTDDDEFDEVMAAASSSHNVPRRASKRCKREDGGAAQFDMLDPGAADLLLHFSRSAAAASDNSSSSDDDENRLMETAEV